MQNTDPDPMSVLLTQSGTEDIDIENFDPFKVGVPDEVDPTPKDKPPEGRSSEMEAILAEVRQLRTAHEALQQKMNQQPTAAPTSTPSAPAQPKVPSMEEIREAYKEDPITALGMMQDRFAMERVMPALQTLMKHYEQDRDQNMELQNKTVTQTAQQHVIDRINAIPGALQFGQEIYDACRAYAPKDFVGTDLADQVIYSVLGRKAAEGNFIPQPNTRRVSLPGGQGGPDHETADVPPLMRNLFKLITGVDAPEGAIDRLRKPLGISVGTGRQG